MGRPISPATSSLLPPLSRTSSLSLSLPHHRPTGPFCLIPPSSLPPLLLYPDSGAHTLSQESEGKRGGQEKGKEEGVSSSSSVLLLLFVSLLSLLSPFPHDSIARERDAIAAFLSLSLSLGNSRMRPREREHSFCGRDTEREKRRQGISITRASKSYRR